MWPNPQFPADLITYTEQIFNGKIHFLWSEIVKLCSKIVKWFTEHSSIDVLMEYMRQSIQEWTK